MNPPQLPSGPNTSGQIVPLSPAESLVAGFWDMDAFGRACEENSFNLEQEMDLIFNLMNSVDEKTRLAALKHFHKLKTEIARANGLLGQKTAAVVTDADGNAAMIVQETSSRLLQQLRKVNQPEEYRKHVDATIRIHEPRARLDADDPDRADNPGTEE